MKKILFPGFLLTLLMFTCCGVSDGNKDRDDLYQGFVTPPAEARPFVRWWWNGDNLSKKEIKRQLDVLHAAGIGGVEINPIQMPQEADDLGAKSVVWLSKEWNEYLALTCNEARERGMIADLIVGSGWPFGGEFLKESETIQRVITGEISCQGGQHIEENLEGLYKKALLSLGNIGAKAKSYELVFMRLVPEQVHSVSEILDLTEEFQKKHRLDIQIPKGKYNLVYGILQRSTRQVMHGAPGAAGPVMNHYESTITRAYLSRLKKISEDTGIPLNQLIRALFCDSIELDGANWTDNFIEKFFDTFNYRLEPWFPFIFYNPYKGYNDEEYEESFADQVKRVRFDYNNLLVKLFHQNFIQEFQDFCSENRVLCRYQAYGTPFLMGMMEGNMIVDIPESNNWIYSNDEQMKSEEWVWNQGHGYMIWNLYASSGGHLNDRKIISCEAMTNTRGVFKGSLEEIKRHDDMNFISGINHSILHGFNYSPPEAGFPGWVRYGEYFNEKNTWWPYFPKWVDYNARLSWIFQQTKPVKKVAILAPEADLWATKGLTRTPFHTQPWYTYHLWESLSQAGSSCDYVSQRVIAGGQMSNKSFRYGPMEFQAIFLSSVQSLLPETAEALRIFVAQGGKLVIIDGVPNRSSSYLDAEKNDKLVKKVMAEIISKYPEQVFRVESPQSDSELLPWTIELLDKIKIHSDIKFTNPDKNIFQIRNKLGDRELYFLVNSNTTKTIKLDARFPTGEKTPWLWNPEDGSRTMLNCSPRNEVSIELSPLKSMLLVFEPDLEEGPVTPIHNPDGAGADTLEGHWEVEFDHINSVDFKMNMDSLAEFGTSPDSRLNSFAGTVVYSTSFSTSREAEWLQLGKVNKGVTEVFLNGESLGVNWYGKPVFKIGGALKKGNNKLMIKYTTVLGNYAMSLKNNKTAQRWTAGYQKMLMGLEGKVIIY